MDTALALGMDDVGTGRESSGWKISTLAEPHSDIPRDMVRKLLISEATASTHVERIRRKYISARPASRAWRTIPAGR